MDEKAAADFRLQFYLAVPKFRELSSWHKTCHFEPIPRISNVNIEALIYLVRGQRVMMDYDLAALYGVETKVLNQAVKRNISRFPPDFRFQLNEIEQEN
jgi:hypothetical protein